MGTSDVILSNALCTIYDIILENVLEGSRWFSSIFGCSCVHVVHAKKFLPSSARKFCGTCLWGLLGVSMLISAVLGLPLIYGYHTRTSMEEK